MSALFDTASSLSSYDNDVMTSTESNLILIYPTPPSQLEGLRAIQEAAVSAADRVQKFLEPLPRGFPPGPDQDVALALAADPLQTIEDLRSEFGGAVGFKLAGERVVLISDP